MRVTLANSVNFYRSDAVKFYSATVEFILKWYVMDDSIEKLDAQVRSLSHGSMTPADYAQELWARTLSFRSVQDKKYLMVLFVETVSHTIHRTF